MYVQLLFDSGILCCNHSDSFTDQFRLQSPVQSSLIHSHGNYCVTIRGNVGFPMTLHLLVSVLFCVYKIFDAVLHGPDIKNNEVNKNVLLF